MGTVELVMAIEDEFRITVPNAIAPTLARLGDLHAFVVQTLWERGDPAEPAATWERLKRVVMAETAIRAEYVVPEAHLVYDLGLD